METKKKKQTRRKFKTPQEREELTRIRKRDNKRDQRRRDKEKAEREKTAKLKDYTRNSAMTFRQQYRRDFYRGLRHRSYNKFLTLTCKDTVSLSWLVSKSKLFISNLKDSGILGNYFLVFEHDNYNYHVHILLFTTDELILEVLTEKWAYGGTKCVDVIDQDSKEAHIYYCTKQLNPDNHSKTSQRLIDSWELDFVSDCQSL